MASAHRRLLPLPVLVAQQVIFWGMFINLRFAGWALGASVSVAALSAFAGSVLFLWAAEWRHSE